jgi:hypothetical protein
MSEIRINKTTEIIADDFTLSEESKLQGVLTFIDEHDDTNDLIYINIGQKQLGWIPKRCLLDLAKCFLKEFAVASLCTKVEDNKK